MRNQGVASRSDEDTSEFNKVYGCEFVQKRQFKELPPLVSDLELKGDPIFSVALLKSHLMTQKVDRWESSLQTSEIGEEKEDVLRFEKLEEKPDNHVLVW